MGNPYGTDVGFATGIHLGPIWVHPYGTNMGPYRISHINGTRHTSCILSKIDLVQLLVIVL